MSHANDGQVSREEWERTEIHASTRYACSLCGREFVMPHDFYEHLDAEHPKKTRSKK